MTSGSGYITQMDYDRELTSFQFRTGPINALTIGGALGQVNGLVTGVQSLCLGTVVEHSLRVYTARPANQPPTDQNAQRERKWLVFYEDTTAFFDAGNTIENQGYHKVFTLELGCANLTLLQNNSDELDITTDEAQDFISSFETLCKSPYGGATRVLKIKAVGRNL